MVFTEYGSPDVLQLKEVETPTPKADEVLVSVHAASIVWADLAFVNGIPFVSRLSSGLLRPKHTIPGMDIAGRVEAVGASVVRFRPGDEVFGDVSESGFGAFAQYACAREDGLARKPANVTFEQAASVPQAATVALQGLRDQGRIRPGMKVLINGASGGNGTFAVQIAKALGAEATGVCSTRNLDLVRSLGADRVIDYTVDDFTRGEQLYDLILDVVANLPIRDYLRALRPNGSYVAVAYHAGALFLGPWLTLTQGKRVSQLSHKPNPNDLVFVGDLIEAGTVVPVIDRQYTLGELAAAFRYYKEGHPRGKVVITMGSV